MSNNISITGNMLPPPTPRNIVLLLFDDVEVLDFAGPYEVFSVAKEIGGANHNITTAAVATTLTTNSNQSLSIKARNGLKMIADILYSDINPDSVNLLIIPGGLGSRRVMNEEKLLEWIRKVSIKAEMIASVCTGSLILARTGLLSSLSHVMTHASAIKTLRSLLPPNVNVSHAGGERYIDNGRISTSGGISSGIDLSLHLVRRLYGEECAMLTRQHMEYYADCYGNGFTQVIAEGPTALLIKTSKKDILPSHL